MGPASIVPWERCTYELANCSDSDRASASMNAVSRGGWWPSGPPTPRLLERLASPDTIALCSRNHSMSMPSNCWPATSNSVARSRVLPVCRHRPVPYLQHLALPLTRSTKTRSADEGTFFKQQPRIYEPTHLILSYSKPRIIPGRFPVSYNPLLCSIPYLPVRRQGSSAARPLGLSNTCPSTG